MFSKPYIESAEALLIYDSIIPVDFDQQLYVYRGRELPSFIHRKMSSHQMGLSELLSVARLHDKLPEEIVLIGIPPGELALGSGISPEVEGLLDRSVAEGKKIIDAWLAL